jgi:hypothetical protein
MIRAVAPAVQADIRGVCGALGGLKLAEVLEQFDADPMEGLCFGKVGGCRRPLSRYRGVYIGDSAQHQQMEN